MAVNLVTVTGNLETLIGSTPTVARLWFKINRPDWNDGGEIFAPEHVEAVAASDGSFTINLQSTDDFENGATYSAVLKYIDSADGKPKEFTLSTFALPTGGPYQLGDLLAQASGGAALLEFQFTNRGALVTAVASGLVPIPGFTYFADGLAYLGQTGATAIPDLPGLVPAPLVASIAWGDVTDKPATFPPSAHTQAISTVTGLQTALDDLDGADDLTNAKLSVNVVDFLAGRTDQQAFQAAVDSLPTVGTFPHTLNTGELPTYEIVVPAKPAGISNTASTFYTLTEHIVVGARDIIWRLDEGARLGATNNAGQRLNGKIVRADGIHLSGFANKRKRVNFTMTQGAAATSYEGMQAGISGYDPDTVATQAFQHERGAANAYAAISDNTEIKVPGSGVTYTATSVSFATPLSAANTENLRIGMLVDTVGNMLTGSPVRHTTRITGITRVSGQCTGLTVETWQRMVADPPFTSATASTPANGTALIINPVNKLWTVNANVFLTKTDGATYGHTSGSVFEAGVWNLSGVRAGTEFDRDTHPFHVWGLDMPHLGAHGGGVAYMVRGQQTWDRAFENRSAEIGFHNHGTSFNNGKLAFVSSSGFDGAYAGWGTGTPAYDFVARSRIGGVWDQQWSMIGGSPVMTIGRRNSASSPAIRFFADGLAGADDAAFDAVIVGTAGSGGTLTYSTGEHVFSAGGAQRLKITSAGAQITGLLSGTAVTQSATDTTAGRLMKVGDGGMLGPLVAAPSNIGVTDNSIPRGAWYNAATTDVTAGLPTNLASAANSYLFHHRRVDAGEVQMLLNEFAVADVDRTIWFRRRTGGAWGNWKRMYDWANVVGTVSQSGGVPTGSVIESGSNANGSYVRFADGTQICARRHSASRAISTAIMGGFRSGAENWFFPAVFIAAPSVTVTVENLTGFGSMLVSEPTVTTAQWAVTANTSQADATRQVSLIAAGRWF